ncbi:MAG: FlgD immunoglobulin-like domain containing protein [Bacteroidota bacterium]
MKARNQMLTRLFIIVVFLAGYGFIYAQDNMDEFIFMNSTSKIAQPDNFLGQVSITNNNFENQSLQSWNLPQQYQTHNGVTLDIIDEWSLLDTVFSANPPEERQRFPEMAFGNSNYLVVWQDNRAGEFVDVDWDVWAARVTPDGEVLDPYGIQISVSMGINAQEPSVAFDGTNFLIIWSEDRDTPGNFNIYGARVSPDGEVLDPGGFPICTESYAQILTGLSFNGTHYLAAWSDWRNSRFDIYGARIEPNGTILEPDGIPIYSAPNNQAYVTVESDGSGWFLSWGAIYETVIRGVRVAGDGAVLDPDGIVISTGPEYRQWPDVSFDGTNYMVVWHDRRSGLLAGNWSVYGARVATDGQVLDPDGIPIATDDSKFEGLAELCFDGTNYLVVWKDDAYTDLGAALLSPDGVIQAPGAFPVTGAPGNETYHAVGHDGNNWLVVWSDFRGAYQDDLYGARVDPSGNILDPYPDDFAIILSASWQQAPNAAFDGNNHMVVWQERVAVDHFDIRGTRVAVDGTPLDSPTLFITTNPESQVDPEIAFGNSVYFAVWKDYRSGPFGSIYGARISDDGTVLDPDGILISQSTSGQRLPAVAFDGTNFFVIWWEYGSDYQYHVYGKRVTEDGTVLDPSVIDIATVTTDYGWNYFVDLSVTFDGENYLAVWPEFDTDNWDIYGARVTPGGVVLDNEGFPISSSPWNQAFPQVSSAGGQTMVVWMEERSGTNDIYCSRVDPDGTVLDPDGIALCNYQGEQVNPEITFDGYNYLVVWSDWRDGSIDTYGTIVDMTGNVMDPNGVAFASSTFHERGSTLSGTSDSKSLVVMSSYEPDTYFASRVWGGVYISPYTGIDDPWHQTATVRMLSNAPNPFSASTKIIIDLQNAGPVLVDVYDITGQQVSRLHDGILAAGHHEIMWNGCTAHGKPLDPGIYLCRLRGVDYQETIMMTLMK